VTTVDEKMMQAIYQLRDAHDEAVAKLNANVIELRTKIDGLVRENVRLTHRVAEINQREELWRGGTPTERLLRLERRVCELEENLTPDEEDEEPPTLEYMLDYLSGILLSRKINDPDVTWAKLIELRSMLLEATQLAGGPRAAP
jgi:predicted RNase H-like nuclease (RuvC/YqgF family)